SPVSRDFSGHGGPFLWSGLRPLASARFLTLLFALDRGDAGSPAQGGVRWVRGAISHTAVTCGQDLARAHRTRDWEPAEWLWSSSWVKRPERRDSVMRSARSRRRCCLSSWRKGCRQAFGPE